MVTVLLQIILLLSVVVTTFLLVLEFVVSLLSICCRKPNAGLNSFFRTKSCLFTVTVATLKCEWCTTSHVEGRRWHDCQLSCFPGFLSDLKSTGLFKHTTLRLCVFPIFHGYVFVYNPYTSTAFHFGFAMVLSRFNLQVPQNSGDIMSDIHARN